MELPAGILIKEGMDTSSVDFRKLFPTLREHNLSGYVALDVLTGNGMEEGTLLYKEGEIIAADYSYLAKNKTEQGEDALKSFMNACLARGSFDVYEMDAEEVVGIREKNKGSVLKYKPDDKYIFSLLPDSFTEKSLEKAKVAISPKVIEAGGGITREEVLKKYGIAHPDERMVDKLLKDVVKEN